MTANLREGALHLDRKNIQGELEQMRYEWPQTEQSVYATEPARSVWAAAKDTVLVAGYSLMQLLREGAPSGESNFKRQIL